MEQPVKTKTIGKYRIELHHDPEGINPRTEYDNMCVMACFHSRYTLGDQAQKDFEWSNTQEGMNEFREWLEEHKDEVVYKPLTLYDHSGISMSVNSSGYPYNCPWDSTSVGAIYVEKARILKEFSIKEWGSEAEQKANDVINAEVETYDHSIQGFVYGYQIFDTERDEETDSCWGYLGEMSYCMEEAESVVKHYLEKDAKWEESAIETTVTIQVKVVVKHSPDTDPNEVVSECDYEFTSLTDKAKITDTEIQERVS